MTTCTARLTGELNPDPCARCGRHDCTAPAVTSLALTQMDLITLDQALNDARWSALDARNAAERLGNAAEADAASALMRASGDLLTRVRALMNDDAEHGDGWLDAERANGHTP